MKAMRRVLGSLLLLSTAAAGAQSPRMFENVLVTPQPVVAGQAVFATMVWMQSCDQLQLVGGEVTLASPNVIRVRAEYEGALIACFPPSMSGVATLPFRAPAAGVWTIDFAGTVRYRIPGGELGPPIPISLRTPPPAVVVHEPAPIPATSRGGLAALSLLLALVALAVLHSRISRQPWSVRRGAP